MLTKSRAERRLNVVENRIEKLESLDIRTKEEEGEYRNLLDEKAELYNRLSDLEGGYDEE